jgi:uncharacterized protein (DUF58 family)
LSEADDLRALIRRVRAIELRTRRRVNAQTSGAYHSRFKGRGMAFSESRAYVPGDEPRHVDWNVTARMGEAHGKETGQLFVKQYVEERELTLLLAVDLSGSLSFGTGARSKRQLAAEVAALLAFSALRNGDKVGLCLFTDEIELLVQPRKGRSHVMRILREILTAEPRGTGTDIGAAVQKVVHLSRQRAIVALITDLVDPASEGGGQAEFLARLERPFRMLAKRHDLMLVEVGDPAERELPDVGLVRMKDPETGKDAIVDTSDRGVRKRFEERVGRERAELESAMKRFGVEQLSVSTREDAGIALSKFLRRRARQ